MSIPSGLLRLSLLVTLALCLPTSAQPRGGAPVEPAPGIAPTTNINRAGHPRILPDHSVIFRVRAPQAQKLQIDLHKIYDMVKSDEGVWTVMTEPQGPGFHYYSLVIDGVAVADPASESFYGMGRMASGIEIPYKDTDAYTIKDVPHGDIRLKRYYSKVTNSWRQLYLYTPPGYDQNTDEKYPVLYILHGGGEDERGWATQGLTDIILDNLIAEGKAKPMLVAMVDGNVVRVGFGEDFLRTFEHELLQCVIPFVEENYRVLTDARSRALAGLSMGGLQTLYAGVPHSDVFGYLGVFSSGWLPRQGQLIEAQYAYMKKNVITLNDNLGLFLLTMGGEEDIAYQNCQRMMQRFDEMGVDYEYYETPGGHTWPVWRDSLRVFAPRLFK
jgi:enterochelin esterase-like enzyme